MTTTLTTLKPVSGSGTPAAPIDVRDRKIAELEKQLGDMKELMGAFMNEQRENRAKGYVCTEAIKNAQHTVILAQSHRIIAFAMIQYERAQNGTVVKHAQACSANLASHEYGPDNMLADLREILKGESGVEKYPFGPNGPNKAG